MKKFDELMSRKSTRIIIISTIFFSFLICLAPGGGSPDTFSSMDQAMKGVYTTWHPPVMALAWKCLLFLQDGPFPMLCFQLLMLCGGCYLLSSQRTGNGGRQWLWLFLPLLPQIYGLAGMIWKDVQMAFSLFLGVALYFYWEANKTSKLPLFASVLFMTYAALVRHNAILAILPIVFFVSFWHFRKKKIIKSFGATFAALILLVSLSNLINFAIGAHKTNPQNVFMIDEISLASHYVNQNLFSKSHKLGNLEVSELPTRFNEKGWNFYGITRNPRFILNDYINLIIKHPLVFLKAKIHLFIRSLHFPLQKVSNKIGYRESTTWKPPQSWLRNKLMNINLFMNNYTIFNKHILRAFFLPIFFIPVSIILLLFNFPAKSEDNKKIIILIFSSNFYLFSYFLSTVGLEYRFLYWYVLGLISCIIIQFYIFLDKYMINRERSAKPCITL